MLWCLVFLPSPASPAASVHMSRLSRISWLLLAAVTTHGSESLLAVSALLTVSPAGHWLLAVASLLRLTITAAISTATAVSHWLHVGLTVVSAILPAVSPAAINILSVSLRLTTADAVAVGGLRVLLVIVGLGSA